MTDGSAVEAMVARVLDELGRIDILVNNAGIMYLEPFAASGEEHWRREMEVNVFGPLRLTHAVVPGMIAQGYGRIVNLSSQLALVGWERAPVYAGTKGFILTWTKSLARELGQHGITVNAIGPGSIITDMNADVYPDEEARRRRMGELAAAPLRRPARRRRVRALPRLGRRQLPDRPDARPERWERDVSDVSPQLLKRVEPKVGNPLEMTPVEGDKRKVGVKSCRGNDQVEILDELTASSQDTFAMHRIVGRLHSLGQGHRTSRMRDGFPRCLPLDSRLRTHLQTIPRRWPN